MKTLIFDTETTGLPLHPAADISKQPKIIEFGAVLLDEDGEVIEQYNELINPQEKLESVITKITGITDDDLVGKPIFKDVLHDITAMFSNADLFVAHNLSFDRSLLAFELQRLGVTDFPWPRRGVCTVEESFTQYGYRPKLIQLYADITGETLDQTHRAIDDVMALRRVWLEGGFHDTFVAHTSRV